MTDSPRMHYVGMDRDEHNLNPYQSPQTGKSSWFRWSRVPFGLYCAYRGYVDQMRKDGGSAVGHLVCWALILLFGCILVAVTAILLRSSFPSLTQYLW